MKLGALGGTFDPIHLGHLRCAEEVRELFDLDRVLFIPAARPPHKDDASVTPFHRREQMVRRAIAGNPFFSFSDMENRREGKSYAVDTVEQLLSEYPGEGNVFYIVGQDAFQLIQTWKEWERLLCLCNFVIMTRPGWKEEIPAHILPPDYASLFKYDERIKGYRGPAAGVLFFRQVTLLDISSSEIRERIGEGKSARYLVPDAVLSYIAAEGCYR